MPQASDGSELFQLLEKVDMDLTGELTGEPRSKSCLVCGGKLHRSDYDCEPRDESRWDARFSL